VSFWNGARVLVTGASGFTGSHLCRELVKEGARVRGLVRPVSPLDRLRDLKEWVELMQGDITDPSSLERPLKGIDYVFHPAAVVLLSEAVARPEKAIEVNTLGAYHVACAAKSAGVKKFLYVGTCHVYGDQPEYPIRETAIPRPVGIYSAAKLSGEVLVRSLISPDFPIVFSRAFAKFGPGQSTQFLISNILSQMLQDKAVQLGDPRPTRDYTYIADIVRGYLRILEKGRPGEIYHLSSGVERSVSEIYETLHRICGARVPPAWSLASRAIDIVRQVGDSTKVRAELGWQPGVDFEEGLRLTVEWWSQRLHHGSLVGS
jgi:nucleoside-diphosphate-sugar epimerase